MSSFLPPGQLDVNSPILFVLSPGCCTQRNKVFPSGEKVGAVSSASTGAEAEITSDYYKKFKNNGLFYIPMKGPHSGQVFQVASAPVDAELTAPTFSPDGKTLFLCVQHPGDSTNKMGEFTSNWPGGKKEDMPRSAVVTIQGPLLDLLTT